MVERILVVALLATGAFAFDDPSGYREIPEWKGMKYRNIGPAWGGRVARAAGVAGGNTFYAATAGGGVWKSTDDGITWKPVFDSQPVSSVGSLAIAPSEPAVIYVGTGEANIRGNVAAGAGIFKSTDGGKTWKHVWKQEGQIGTMVVHPSNPDIAFAAVLGHAFGPNAERGVYRTRDGGKTWQQVLKKDDNTGASDVALDPSNPNIVYAGLWETRRFPWDLKSGGPGSGLWVSRDGGDSWTQLKEKGLPKGIWGKVGVAVAPSDGRIVFALIEAEEGGLFRSSDAGDTWTRVSASRLIRQRAWYYTTLTIHPGNPNELWFPSVPMLKSIDGGKTLEFAGPFAHGDHHDLWIDPKNPKRMIDSNDGGLEISHDGGETWFQPALPISQFYHVSADNRLPYQVAGAMQDIGTAQGPSDSLSSGGIRNGEWYGVGGGEAGHVVSDPSDPDIVYAGEYGGVITRYDHKTRQARNVSAYPENPSGHGGEDFAYRFQWTAPIAVSPHDPKTVYHGAQVVLRTRDGGQSWEKISPDLTRNDRTKQKWAGGPITGDNTGVEVYCTVFAIAESPVEKGLIWAGSDDGLVHFTRDGGKTWTNVTEKMPGFPEWGTVRTIEPSHFAAGTAYVVASRHRLDDNEPYLYRTTDYGATWTRLDRSLPRNVYLHVIREDPTDKRILYLGTERGVAVSLDAGESWNSLRLNLPTVAVHDIVVKDHSLVLATMGRSLWILDQLRPIRTWNSQVAAKAAHLFAPEEVIAWVRDGRPKDRYTGENPAAGVAIQYYLRDPVKKELRIEILDAQGNVIRKLTKNAPSTFGFRDNEKAASEAAQKAALPNEKGIQQAVWNLRHAGAVLIQGAKIDMGNPMIGPLALPGTYTVRLIADEITETATVKVKPDPREKVSDSDRREQFNELITLRDSLGKVTAMVETLRAIRRQLKARNDLLLGDARATELLTQSMELSRKLDQLEANLHNPKAEVVYDILAFQGGTKLYSRMAWVYSQLNEGAGPPTQGVKEVFAEQLKEFGQYDSAWKRMLDADLGSLNVLARKLELPTIHVPVFKGDPGAGFAGGDEDRDGDGDQ